MEHFEVQIIKTLNQKEMQIPVLIDDVTLERNYNSSASTLTFTCQKDENLSFSPGEITRLIVDNQCVFVGRVFKKSRNADHKIQVTAYDNMRYLLNQDTVVLGQDDNGRNFYTLNDLLRKITGIFEGYKPNIYERTADRALNTFFSINYNISEKYRKAIEAVRLDPVVYEDKSYLDMILDTFEKIKNKGSSFSYEKTVYGISNYDLVLYDYNGTLTVRMLSELQINSNNWVDPDIAEKKDTNLISFKTLNEHSGSVHPFSGEYNSRVIGTHNTENFSHDESIDEDTYTVVKLVSDDANAANKETQKSNVFVDTADKYYLAQYGPLVHYEKIDDATKLKSTATSILKEKSFPKNTSS